MLTVVHDADASNENGTAVGSLLDEIVRDGARKMLAAALQAEVAAYIDAHADQLDEHGRRVVVSSGYHAGRQRTTAAGAVPAPLLDVALTMPYAPPPITMTAAITAIDLASLGENIEGPPFMGATTLMVANDAWSKLRGDTPPRAREWRTSITGRARSPRWGG